VLHNLGEIGGELIEGAGIAPLHARETVLEDLTLMRGGVDGDRVESQRRLAIGFGEGRRVQHLRRPFGAQEVARYASFLVGEGHHRDNALRLDDLPIDEAAPHLLTTWRTHAVVEHAARRKSSEPVTQVKPLGPHHRLRSSSSLCAFHTRSRGASNTREITKAREVPKPVLARCSSRRSRCCSPPSIAPYSLTTRSRSAAVGNTARMVIRALLPWGSKVQAPRLSRLAWLRALAEGL